MPDIVDLIMSQHRTLESLLSKAQDEKSDTLAALAELQALLAPHSDAEESFVYPRIAELNQQEKASQDRAAEHHHAAAVLTDLLNQDPDDPGYDGMLAGLVGELHHHIEEEEAELLPVLSSRAGKSERSELGDRFAAATGVSSESPARSAFDETAAPAARGDGEGLSRDELYQRAKERNIPGRSGMSKSELAAALQNA